MEFIYGNGWYYRIISGDKVSQWAKFPSDKVIVGKDTDAILLKPEMGSLEIVNYHDKTLTEYKYISEIDSL